MSVMKKGIVSLTSHVLRLRSVSENKSVLLLSRKCGYYSPLLSVTKLPYPAIRGTSLPSVCHESTGKQVLINHEAEDDILFQMVEVEVKGHEPAVLQSYQWFVTYAAKELDISVGKCWEPPRDYHRFTLLKSVFVYKKHRVQYEVRTYFRVMQFLRLTGSTADTFLEYIQRNLPEGVAMKVTKHALEKLPEHVRQPPPHQTSIES